MSEPGDTVEADEAIRPGLEKSPDAFRTISEVSQALDVPQHVLRFWEGKFAQIRPLKRGGGRRYYRPDDVDLLRGIQSLLYGDGYTIKGVQKLLRENGAKFVIAAGRRRAEPAKAKVAAVPRAAPAPQPEPVEAPPRRPPGPVKAPPAQPVVPISTPDVVEAIPGMPAPVLPPAEPEPEPSAQTEGGLAPLSAAARREAAARLLSHLKAMRRDFDLGLQAAKNGRTR